MTATITNAQSCEDTLFKCDRALESQRQLSDIQKQIIQDQEQRFAVVTNQLNEERAEAKKWYHDGVLVGSITLSLGLIIGLSTGLVNGR